MISVAILDDHPALRAGLEAVLRGEPGLTVVGAVASLEEFVPLLERGRPDVVLLDYHLPGDDGLLVCRQLKRCSPAPRVLVYSAYAGGALAIPARLAGADGIIGKGLPAHELYDAIRLVARGERVGPPTPPGLHFEAVARLDPDDLPIFEMALASASESEISRALGLDQDLVQQRLDSVIRRLRVEVPELNL